PAALPQSKYSPPRQERRAHERLCWLTGNGAWVPSRIVLSTGETERLRWNLGGFRKKSERRVQADANGPGAERSDLVATDRERRSERETVAFFIGEIGEAHSDAHCLVADAYREPGIEIVTLSFAKLRPHSQARAADIVRPACRGEFEVPAERAAVIDAYAAGKLGDVRHFGDVLEQPGRQVFKAAREVRDVEQRKDPFEQQGRGLVDAAVIIGQPGIDTQCGAQRYAAGERRGPDPAIANIGGAGKAVAVDEVGLDVPPARISNARRHVERTATAMSAPSADLEGCGPVVTELRNEVPGDRQPTRTETLLITHIERRIRSQVRRQRS